MARRTSESPTRDGLLARRAVVMAELGMLDADFDERHVTVRYTESQWTACEELEQITVLLDADTWFTSAEINAAEPVTAYRWSAAG